VVTGQTENVEFKPVNFSWYPRWVVVLVLLNLLIAAIVAFALTRRVKGSLPFTEEAYKAWKVGQVLFALSIVVCIATLIVGVILMSNRMEWLGFATLMMAIGVPIFVGVRFMRHKGPVVQKIADGEITLKLPSEKAVQAIQQHLIAGLHARGAALQGVKKQSA
jgi:hypothetical protein